MRESAMDRRLKYRRKSGQFVVAVRLDLDTNGLSYHKWGGRQRAKRGDWLVGKNVPANSAGLLREEDTGVGGSCGRGR
jgi:hypothetical protein